MSGYNKNIVLEGRLWDTYKCPAMKRVIMRDIVGRKSELKELEEIFLSGCAEFTAVYGRRRVGKTFLIKTFFQSKKCVYFQMTGIYRGTIDKQLLRFSKELGTAFYNGAAMKVPSDWMEAFDQLFSAIKLVEKTKKVILFFDELPWMATRKSGVVSALEYFWNRHWSDDKRVKLIVCGSAASWMIKKIVRNRGGLHNRVTRKIRLLPFSLRETYQFLQKRQLKFTKEQALKIYMIMGGIPFYLMQLKKSSSIDQNISKLFFDPNGFLFDEFDDIFSSLFDNSEQYEEIITLISKNHDGLSRKELEKKNKLTGKGGRLTKRLENLENAGFIKTYMPFGHKKLGLFYRISDPYCYFYTRWIKPIKNKLQQDYTSSYWKNIINTPEYYSWMGYAFESVCYQHLREIKTALFLEESCMASPWRYAPKKGSIESGAQIDLLFDRNDDAITICEIKYTDHPFLIDKDYSQRLKKKIDVFQKITRTKNQLFLVMLSVSGLKKNMYSEELISNIITIDDLF